MWKHAIIGMCFVDLDNTIVAVNPTFAEWLGYPPSSLEGMKFTEITKGSDVKEDLDGVESIRRGHIDSYRMQKTYHGRDGTPLPASLTVVPVRTEDGSVVLAYFSQISKVAQATKIIAKPEASDWIVFFTLLGKYKKSFILSMLVFVLISAEVRDVAFREGGHLIAKLLGWDSPASEVDTHIETP